MKPQFCWRLCKAYNKNYKKCAINNETKQHETSFTAGLAMTENKYGGYFYKPVKKSQAHAATQLTAKKVSSYAAIV